MTIEKAARKLAKAMRRLEIPQGDLARRNARRAVKLALRAIEAAMDEEYPRPPKKTGERVAGLTPPQRLARKIRRMLKLGYAEWTQAFFPSLPDYAEVGIRVVKTEFLTKTKEGVLAIDKDRHSWWVPAWTKAFRGDAAGLKKAKADLTFRRISRAAHGMAQDSVSP